MSVSVCLSACVCVCVCLSGIISSELHVRFSPYFSACYLWPRLGRPLCISGFVDDVIFAHKLIGCSTSSPRIHLQTRTAVLKMTRCRTGNQ